MKLNRRWAVGIGVLAMINAVFYARELASWRPVVVAKVGFLPRELRFSRDGKWLLARSLDSKAAFINVENLDVDTKVETDFDFDKKHGLRTYPRVWMSQVRRHLDFSAAPNRNVRLSGAAKEMQFFYSRYSSGVFPAAWSKARGEVYNELLGEIWIWNWRDGTLKKRVRYARPGSINADAVFSSDGRWLLSFGMRPDGSSFLRRYDVQTGQMMATLSRNSAWRSFGFSPDNQRIWFVEGRALTHLRLNVIGTVDSKLLWSADCAEPVKWLPDGRVGIVQTGGFEWRDASGRADRHLPGPFFDDGHWSNHVTDWALSPDGQWIYSADGAGIIRRWRAK